MIVDSKNNDVEDLSGVEKKFLEEKVSSDVSGKTPGENSKKWKLIFAAIGVIILILIILNSIKEMHELHNPSIPVTTQLENARTSMFFLTLELENYRQINGTFPDTLDPEMQTYDLEYDLSAAGIYTLTYSSEDTSLVFRSIDDPAELVSEQLSSEVFGEELP